MFKIKQPPSSIVAYIGIIIFIVLGIAALIGLVMFFPMLLALSVGMTGHSHGPPTTPEPIVASVEIPEGAALADTGKNFEPATIRVVIGNNNTVRWYNNDYAQSSVIADNDSDPGFFNATHLGGSNGPTAASSLYPGEIFEYTFNKVGTFGYHSEPHPWMQGTVIVLPPTQ